MPEYLAPGVYVEEVSYRSKSIEGVSTTTTGFIGPARYGPFDLEPDVITSLGEFERTYGNGEQLEFEDGTVMDNYLWQGVRAFFTEGGKRLYISRVWRPQPRQDTDGGPSAFAGYARETVRKGQSTSAADAIQVWARYPGRAGNFRVRFTLRLGQNVFAVDDPTATTPRRRVRGLIDYDIVHIEDAGSPPLSDGFHVALSYFSEITKEREWRFQPEGGGAAVELQTFNPNPNVTQVRLVNMTVSVMPPGEDISLGVWDSLPLDPRHERAGTPDSMFAQFAHNPGRLPPGETVVNIGQARTLPIRLEVGDDLETGLDVLRDAFFTELAALETELLDPDSSDLERSLEITLLGGNDGIRPTAGDYEGEEIVLGPGLATVKTGFKTFEDIEDISIVAAPGSTFGYETSYTNDAKTIINLLIQHAQQMRYRIAVLDSGERPGHLRGTGPAGAGRLHLRRPLLPLGAHPRSAHREGELHAAQRLRGRHLLPQRHRPRGLQGPGQRGGEPGHRLRAAPQQEPAGRPEPGRHQLLPLLRGPRLPALGRAHHQLGPRVEVREPAPLLRLPGAVDRQGHAVGGVRAQRRAALGQRAPHDRGLPAQRMA